MKPEFHLFIIWHNCYDYRTRIIDDIGETFTIVKAVEITWSDAHFLNNLSRFYGGKLPPGCSKEQRIGRGPFTVLIVSDDKPEYDRRFVKKRRWETVNVRTYDAKMKYREWSEGPKKISDLVHATNSPKEIDHDFTLLFGRTPHDFFGDTDAPRWNGGIERLDCDVIGFDGWRDINELFYVMNAAFEYVVLRNFEALPESYPLAHESDIDLLVENYIKAVLIMNASPVTDVPNRVLNEVRIGEDTVRFDLRHVGDDYYDQRWEETILETRITEAGGFYRPDETQLFYTLLYHALIQKPFLRDDYREKLSVMAQKLGIGDISKQVLDDFLKRNGYRYVRPVDGSVFYNEAVVGGYVYLTKKIFRVLKNPHSIVTILKNRYKKI